MMNKLFESISLMDICKFDEDRICEILDNRDIDAFDDEWCRAYEEINCLKNDNNYTEQNKQECDIIRQKAFFIIENKVSSELSDYISDDFGLIYDSIVVGYKNDWLNKLINEYLNGRIPSGLL